MKFAQCLSLFAATLALASGLHAAPQLTGSAIGQAQQVDTQSMVVLADMASDASDTAYELRMALHGDGAGQARGQMHQLPQKNGGPVLLDLVYDVEGRFATQTDGRILIQAHIVLDLAQFGAKGRVIVGEMEGLVYPALNALGYCPVLPLAPASAEADPAEQPKDSADLPQLIDPTLLEAPQLQEFVARWVLY